MRMLVKQGQPFPQTCYVTGGMIIPRINPEDVGRWTVDEIETTSHETPGAFRTFIPGLIHVFNAAGEKIFSGSSEVYNAACGGGGVFFYVEESGEHGPMTRDEAEFEAAVGRFYEEMDWGERW